MCDFSLFLFEIVFIRLLLLLLIDCILILVIWFWYIVVVYVLCVVLISLNELLGCDLRGFLNNIGLFGNYSFEYVLVLVLLYYIVFIWCCMKVLCKVLEYLSYFDLWEKSIIIIVIFFFLFVVVIIRYLLEVIDFVGVGVFWWSSRWGGCEMVWVVMLMY